MYKTDVTIYCAKCGKAKQLLKTEYDRQIRNGRKDFYCSRKCHSRHVYSLGHLKNAPDGKKYMIRKITLMKDENGQYMPHQWVRDRLISFYPDLAKYSMPSADIDMRREEWSKETVKPTKPVPSEIQNVQLVPTTEELQPIPDEIIPPTLADESHDAPSDEAQHRSIDEIIEGQMEMGEDNEPSRADDLDYSEYIDPYEAAAWKSGSPAMFRLWEKEIALQEAYENNKLPFTAGELSLREEMSRAAAEVLETDSLCAGAYEQEYELEALKVIKARKARIYEAEIMADNSEDEGNTDQC
jgi:hypothetical protein